MNTEMKTAQIKLTPFITQTKQKAFGLFWYTVAGGNAIVVLIGWMGS